MGDKKKEQKTKWKKITKNQGFNQVEFGPTKSKTPPDDVEH